MTAITSYSSGSNQPTPPTPPSMNDPHWAPVTNDVDEIQTQDPSGTGPNFYKVKVPWDELVNSLADELAQQQGGASIDAILAKPELAGKTPAQKVQILMQMLTAAGVSDA